MPDEEARITKTTGSEAAHERRKANPDGKDMSDPRQVWREGETNPAPDPRTEVAGGGRGRVADGGDLGSGQPGPYSTETQADALAKQTNRKGEPTGVEKPKR